MSLLLAHPLSLLIHRQAVNSVNEPGGSSCSVPNFALKMTVFNSFNFINFTKNLGERKYLKLTHCGKWVGNTGHVQASGGGEEDCNV